MNQKILGWIIVTLGFILGVRDGYIALWQDGCCKPAQTFPYSVELLPKQDQELLKKGIHVESREELVRLVEDYLS